ncbi:MAG: histidine phosphatase family protein [bacterium]|nr:histidine phosphatase family protein [bacterium]
MPATKVHLVRHGEVENPHHVVYADLPGYGLSRLGQAQATATGLRLADHDVSRVVSSPLLRARQTAAAIADKHGTAITIEGGLTEWEGGVRWAGVRWEDLDTVFPGELTEYLETPLELDLGAETIQECGARLARTVNAMAESIASGELVFVSHQDTVHAGYLHLTGQLPATAGFRYHDGKPTHASVITLEPDGETWRRVGYWEPDQGEAFPPLD